MDDDRPATMKDLDDLRVDLIAFISDIICDLVDWAEDG